jgi:GNAT superfamily N-acetyltransferase
MHTQPSPGEVLARFTLQADVLIRTCREDDLLNLEWFGMFTSHREIIRSTWQRQQRGEQWMLLADLRGFPVGQVWIDLATKRTERTGWLWAVRVIRCLQRLGIGRQLIQTAEQVLLRRDYVAAELAVERFEETFSAADRFYQRLGYRPTGTYHQAYADRTPSGEPTQFHIEQVVYRKSLKPA